MAAPSRRMTATAVILLASMLACNMPLPGQSTSVVSDTPVNSSEGDMTLDQAVATEADDSRGEVLHLMGAPDAFSLHWQTLAGHRVRWEEWSYFDAGTRFDFVDGELVWTADLYTTPDGTLYAHQYDPTAFEEGASLESLRGVLDLLGPQDLETIPLDDADVPGGSMVVGDQILLGFDQGRLVSVDTFVLAPEAGATSGSVDHLSVPPSVRPNASLPVSPLPAVNASGGSRPALQGGGLSSVIPVVGFFVGWSHRNRIYRQAERFIADRNAYYDQLRGTARKQLINRDVAGLRPSQVAAYTKLVAMIEDQRKAELAVAEASKNQARQAFNKRVEGLITQRLLGSGMVQRVFGAVNKGLNSSQSLLDHAIQGLSGGAGGVLGDIQRIQSTARDIERWASAIGGPTGAGIRAAAGRIASALQHPQDLVKSDLEKVQTDLTDLQDGVDTLAKAGRTPSAGALAQGAVFGPAAGDDPAVQAVTILVSRLSVGDGSLKDKAQAALDTGFVGRCAAVAEAYRAALDRLQAGSGEALSAEQAAAPCRAMDPNQLAQEAASAPTPAAAATQGQVSSGIGSDTGLKASLKLVSVNYSKANCFDSSVNGWSYCDVTTQAELQYQAPSVPAVVNCFFGEDFTTQDVDQPSGSVTLQGVDNTRNVSLGPLGALMYCELQVGGETVAASGPFPDQ